MSYFLKNTQDDLLDEANSPMPRCVNDIANITFICHDLPPHKWHLYLKMSAWVMWFLTTFKLDIVQLHY